MFPLGREPILSRFESPRGHHSTGHIVRRRGRRGASPEDRRPRDPGGVRRGAAGWGGRSRPGRRGGRAWVGREDREGRPGGGHHGDERKAGRGGHGRGGGARPQAPFPQSLSRSMSRRRRGRRLREEGNPACPWVYPVRRPTGAVVAREDTGCQWRTTILDEAAGTLALAAVADKTTGCRQGRHPSRTRKGDVGEADATTAYAAVTAALSCHGGGRRQGGSGLD